MEVPRNWINGTYELELQKLLDAGNNDPNVLDRCNRILPTYNGFLHSFKSKGLAEDNLQEWDEDLFKNALQGRKRKRRRGAMDSNKNSRFKSNKTTNEIS